MTSELNFAIFVPYSGPPAYLDFVRLQKFWIYIKKYEGEVTLETEKSSDSSRYIVFKFSFPPKMKYTNSSMLDILKDAKFLLKKWFSNQKLGSRRRNACTIYDLPELFRKLYNSMEEKNRDWKSYDIELGSDYSDLYTISSIFDFDFGVLAMIAYWEQFRHINLKNTTNEKNTSFALTLRKSLDSLEETFAQAGACKASINIYSEWKQKNSPKDIKQSIFDDILADVKALQKNTGNPVSEFAAARVEVIKKAVAKEKDGVTQLLEIFFNHIRFDNSSETRNVFLGEEAKEKSLIFLKSVLEGCLDSCSTVASPLTTFIHLWKIANVPKMRPISLEIMAEMLSTFGLTYSILPSEDRLEIDLSSVPFLLMATHQLQTKLNLAILVHLFRQGRQAVFDGFVDHSRRLFTTEPGSRVDYLNGWLPRVLLDPKLPFEEHRKLICASATIPELKLSFFHEVMTKCLNSTLLDKAIEERGQYVAIVLENLFKKDYSIKNKEYLGLLKQTILDDEAVIMDFSKLRDMLAVTPRFVKLILESYEMELKSRAATLDVIFGYLTKAGYERDLVKLTKAARPFSTLDGDMPRFKDISDYLSNFYDDIVNMNLPLRKAAFFMISNSKDKQVFSKNEERINKFVEVVAKITAPSLVPEAMNDHRGKVANAMEKLIANLMQVRSDAIQLQSQLTTLENRQGVISTITDLSDAKIVLCKLEFCENDESVATVVNNYQKHTGGSLEKLEIFNKKVNTNELMHKILVFLAYKLTSCTKADYEKKIDEISSTSTEDLLPNLVSSIIKDSSWVQELSSLNLSLIQSARLQNQALKIFEDLMKIMDTKMEICYQELAKVILDDCSMRESISKCSIQLTRVETRGHMESLCRSSFDKLQQLKNMAYLRDVSLIAGLKQFVEDHLGAKQEAKAPANLGDLLDAARADAEKGKISSKHKEIVPLLAAFSSNQAMFKGLKILYPLFEEMKPVTDKTIDELMYDSEVLKQFNLSEKHIGYARSFRQEVVKSETWLKMLEGLNDLLKDHKEAFNMVSNNRLPDISRCFKNHVESRKGTEQKKREAIFRIPEHSTISFYREKGEEKYSLYVFVKDNDAAKPFDMNFPLAKNKEIDTMGNIVSEEAFISMQTKAVFLKEFDTKEQDKSVWKRFDELATEGLEILNIFNYLERDNLVTNLIQAIRFNSGLKNFLSIGVRLVDVDQGWKNIAVEVKESESKEKFGISMLLSIAKKLKQNCEEAKKRVFVSEILNFYSFSCFQAHQIKLLDKFLRYYNQKSDLKADLERKTLLLIKHSGCKFSLEKCKLKMHTVSKKKTDHSEITYDQIPLMKSIFEDEAMTLTRGELSKIKNVKKHDNSKFIKVQFDQGNRIKAMLFVCRPSQTWKTVRALFCCAYTRWTEVEVFLLSALNDLEENDYIIIDPQLLEVEIRHNLLSELNNSLEIRDNFINTNVKVLVPTKHKSRIDEEISHRYKRAFDEIKITTDASESDIQGLVKKVLLVRSENAGLGKTYFIEKDSKSKGFTLFVLNLTGKMTPDLLKARLTPIYHALGQERDKTKVALRIKIDITESVKDTFYYLDQLLFKICVMKVIEFGSSYLGFEDVHMFYIEVQNTLDKRLLGIDFIKFLIEIGNEINLKPPFKTRKLEPYNQEIDTDECSTMEENPGPNQLDFSELMKIGLLECLSLHFLMTERLADNNRAGTGEDNTLIEYINPDQLAHPCLKWVAQKQLEEEEKKTFPNRHICLELRSIVQDATLFSDLVSSDSLQKIARDSFNKKQELENLVKSIHKEVDRANPGYPKYLWLVQAIFKKIDLKKEIQKIRPLLETNTEDLWLMLLLESMDTFLIEYSDFQNEALNLEARHGDKKEKAAKEKLRGKIVKCLEFFLNVGNKEDSSFEYEDINFYHIKTLLKLTKQLVQQLNRAQNLNMTTMLSIREDPVVSARQAPIIAEFRKGLVEKCTEQNQNFSFKQIISVRWLQRESFGVKDPSNDNIMEKMVQAGQIRYHWFFLQDGVLKLIQNENSNLDEDTVHFYKSQQKISSGGENPQKERTQKDYIEELCESFGGLKKEREIKKKKNRIIESLKSKKKRFMITADNYLKIRLIIQRAEIGIPIILLGESGCGKTFMIEFISEQRLQEDEDAAGAGETPDSGLKMMTFHSGVTERELSDMIMNCIDEANRRPERKLWLFLDEINTTPLLPNIAELITERRAYFSKQATSNLPDNIVIVAACNPYQKEKSKKEFSAGISTESNLVHKVYPLPENLISYCFNYGQLNPKDEKAMIRTILEDSNITEVKNIKDILTDCLSIGQILIRRYENESAASLRDVRRFINLLGTLQSRNLWSFSDCLKLTFYCCYSIRLQHHEAELPKDQQPKEASPSFNSQVEKLLQHIFGTEMSEMTINQKFNEVSKQLIEEAKSLSAIRLTSKPEGNMEQSLVIDEGESPKASSCFDGIAINRPLMENVFILLHSFLSGIPVYICGRPGTSKSVSIDIIKTIFNFKDKVKDGSKYFRDLPLAEFYPLWGSKETTAKQVEDEFKKVHDIAKKFRESEESLTKKILRVIYFEEMGVADTNQNNPLKVLHPLLEPREKDTETDVCFVGLSNTLLDAAKLNRLLSVPRFDMDNQELQATITQYNIDEKLKAILSKDEADYPLFEKLTQRKVAEALVLAYKDFREYEKKSKVHRDFHGPRDFYTMCKWIDANLHVLTKVFEEEKQAKLSDQRFYQVLYFFLLAIERNFSGRELHTVQGKDDSDYKNCCFKFKNLFLEKLVDKKTMLLFKEPNNSHIFDTKSTTTRMISMNLSDPHARHLMIFIEGSFYVDSVVAAIRKYQIKQGFDEKRIKFLNDEKQPIMNLINDFNSYIDEGFTVIMRNMDAIYPSLYDLFNQRYTITEDPQDSTKSKKSCQIAHGTSVTPVDVNDRFKCIILMDKPTPEDSADVKDFEERWPTALLNRFEKHILILEELVDEKTYMRIKATQSHLEKRSLKPEQYIHNWSKVLIESSIAKKAETKIIDLPIETSEKWIQQQVVDNLLKSKSVVKIEPRPFNETRYGKVEVDEADLEEEEFDLNLRKLYNTNYIYYLHLQYKESDPTQKALRDQLFGDFYNNQMQRSIKNLILDHKNKAKDSNYKNKGYVAFSLAQPYEIDLRELIEVEEELHQYKENIAIVEYVAYNSISVRNEQIKNAIMKSHAQVFIFQFKNSEEWSHLEEYLVIIRDLLDKDTKSKMVILLAHNSSFDETEKQKFRFPFIHFHSDFEPISLDVIGTTTKSDHQACLDDYKKCYDILGKTPQQILTEADDFMNEVKECLNQEFGYGKPYVQDHSRFEELYEFITDRDLMREILIPIYRNSIEELEKMSKETTLNPDIPLVNIIQKLDSDVIDIVEIVKKNILPLLHNMIQVTLRAVHHRCDIFHGLRLFKKLKRQKMTAKNRSEASDSKLKQLETRLQLWETVAKRTKLSGNQGKTAADIMIYTDADSKEHPRVFYENLFKYERKTCLEWIPIEERIRYYNDYTQSLLSSDEAISDEVICMKFSDAFLRKLEPHLRRQMTIDIDLWTDKIESLEDKEFLYELLVSTTNLKSYQGKVTVRDLLGFSKPVLSLCTDKKTAKWKMSDVFYLLIIILECFPQEIEVFSQEISEDLKTLLALKPLENMQELKLRFLVEQGEIVQLKKYAQEILEPIGKTDENSINFFIEASSNPSTSIKSIKMDLLKASITEEYRQAAALMKTGIDNGRLLESAARDLQEIILLHKTDQANLKFTNEWTCALLEVLQETPVDKIDELSSDEQAIFNCLLIDEPAKELAHVLAGHLSLQAAGSAVVLASSLPSLAALGSPEKAEIKMVFNTDILEIFANELFSRLYATFIAKVNLELEDAVRSRNLVPDRHPLLSVFLFEVGALSSASSLYVPGKQTFIQVKTNDESSYMDLCLILKLALLSAVFDAPFIQQALEVVNRFDPQFIDRLVLFLTNSTGPYRYWIFNFQSKLYNVSRAYPLVAIETLICEQIQPKGHSFHTRVVGFAIKIKNALQKSKQMNGLFVFSIEKIKRNITTITEIEEIENFLEALMKAINNRPEEFLNEIGTRKMMSSVSEISRPLDDDQLPAQFEESLFAFEKLETKVLELHRFYGKRHSKYHFLEYLWTQVQRLALDTDASSRQIADQLLEAMKNYRNPSKSDRAIYHLPFVGHRWDSNPHQETDGLERLLESVEQADNDSIAAWKEVENCSRLAVWIMRLRDLLVTVIDAGDRTIEETKKTRLSDLLQDSGREAELVLDLRETLEEMDSQSENMQSHLKFEGLYLSDLTDRNGRLRKRIGDLVRTYNEKIIKAAKILNYNINGQKGLSELELHHTFRLTSATLFRRLTEKYSGITQKKRFLKTALSTELRIDLHELKEIKDDVSHREFIYSDCRVQTLIGMAKNHPLWIESSQRPVALYDRQQFLKYFKYCPVATMMRFENSLFGLFENRAEERTENLCLRGTEIMLRDMNILCPLEFVMDIHRLILLRKLHRIFQQNQTKRVVSDSAQYDDVLFRIFDDNSNTEKLVANCVFLAAIAENKDEKGILKIIRISKDEYNWKKPLESIDSIKEAVEDFKKNTKIESEITLADVLAACAKVFEVELQRISK